MYDKAKGLGKFPTVKLDANGDRLVCKRMVVFIDELVHEEFSDYCKLHGLIRPRLIGIILEDFLDQYGAPVC